MSMFGNEDDESLDASLENLLKEGHSAAVGDHPDVKGTTDDKGDKRSSTDELADLLLGKNKCTCCKNIYTKICFQLSSSEIINKQAFKRKRINE